MFLFVLEIKFFTVIYNRECFCLCLRSSSSLLYTTECFCLSLRSSSPLLYTAENVLLVLEIKFFTVIYNRECFCMCLRSSSSLLYTTENVSVCAWDQVLHCYVQQRRFLFVLEIKFFTVMSNREGFCLCLRSSSSLLCPTEKVSVCAWDQVLHCYVQQRRFLFVLEIKFFTVIYNRECFCMCLRSSSSLLYTTECFCMCLRSSSSLLYTTECFCMCLRSSSSLLYTTECFCMCLRSSSSLLYTTENVSVCAWDQVLHCYIQQRMFLYVLEIKFSTVIYNRECFCMCLRSSSPLLYTTENVSVCAWDQALHCCIQQRMFLYVLEIKFSAVIYNRECFCLCLRSSSSLLYTTENVSVCAWDQVLHCYIQQRMFLYVLEIKFSTVIYNRECFCLCLRSSSSLLYTTENVSVCAWDQVLHCYIQQRMFLFVLEIKLFTVIYSRECFCLCLRSSSSLLYTTENVSVCAWDQALHCCIQQRMFLFVLEIKFSTVIYNRECFCLCLRSSSPLLYTTENVSVCAWDQVLHCYIQQRMFLYVLEIKFSTVIYNRECFCMCLRSSSPLLYTTENVSVCAWDQVLHCYIQQRMFLYVLEIKLFTVIYNRECFCMCLRSSSSLLYTTENVSVCAWDQVLHCYIQQRMFLYVLEIKLFTVIYNRECFCLCLRSSSSLLYTTENVSVCAWDQVLHCYIQQRMFLYVLEIKLFTVIYNRECFCMCLRSRSSLLYTTENVSVCAWDQVLHCYIQQRMFLYVLEIKFSTVIYNRECFCMCLRSSSPLLYTTENVSVCAWDQVLHCYIQQRMFLYVLEIKLFTVVYNRECFCMCLRSSSPLLYTTENVSVCAWDQVLHCYIQQRMFLYVLEIKLFTVIYNRECFCMCLRSSSSLLYTTENVSVCAWDQALHCYIQQRMFLYVLEIKFFTVIYNRECFCLCLRSSSPLLYTTENVSVCAWDQVLHCYIQQRMFLYVLEIKLFTVIYNRECFCMCLRSSSSLLYTTENVSVCAWDQALHCYIQQRMFLYVLEIRKFFTVVCNTMFRFVLEIKFFTVVYKRECFSLCLSSSSSLFYTTEGFCLCLRSESFSLLYATQCFCLCLRSESSSLLYTTECFCLCLRSSSSLLYTRENVSVCAWDQVLHCYIQQNVSVCAWDQALHCYIQQNVSVCVWDQKVLHCCMQHNVSVSAWDQVLHFHIQQKVSVCVLGQKVLHCCIPQRMFLFVLEIKFFTFIYNRRFLFVF